MRTVDAAGLSIGDDAPPRIMGVLNVSEESPYDPSVFADPGEAATYVDRELIDQGADIVDIGLESANKRFDVLDVEGELARLETAVETIDSVGGDAVFSIETRYHEVAEKALSQGFDMVNDICGFADPAMPRVCADYDVAVSKMASPPDLDRPGALTEVDEIYEALFHNGLTEKTLIDPAFGGWCESKTLADDRETFDRLREFRAIGHPILVSINRKNFLREIADRSTEDALPVSLAATAMAVERGAHVIRTHDVAKTRDAALVGDTFTRERIQTGGDGDSPGTEIAIEELDVTTVREASRHLKIVDEDGDSTASDVINRLYRLDGIDEQSLTALRGAAGETDAVLVDGGVQPVRANGGQEELTVFVGGSVSAIRELAEHVDAPPALRAALAVV